MPQVSGGSRMVLTTWLVTRSIATSLGPPGTVFLSRGAPVSSTQRRPSPLLPPLGSTTTDWTETKWVWSADSSVKALGLGRVRPGQLLISALG